MPPKATRPGRPGSGAAQRGSTGAAGRRPTYTPEQQRERLFATLQSAQDGVSHTSIKTAMREIDQGQKRTHWIWYVFPSLKALRPGTQRPHFLLPNFATAQALLAADPLGPRLVEATERVLAQLRAGTPLSTLMGGGTDARKFRECATVFALAAATAPHEGARRQRDLFLDCLDHAESGEPAWRTAELRVAAMASGGDGRGGAAKRALAGAQASGARRATNPGSRGAAAAGPGRRATDGAVAAAPAAAAAAKGPPRAAQLDQRAAQAVIADPTAPKGAFSGVANTYQVRRIPMTGADAGAPESAEPAPPEPEAAATEAAQEAVGDDDGTAGLEGLGAEDLEGD